MMTRFTKILTACIFILASSGSCTKSDIDSAGGSNGDIPTGYARLDVSLVAANGKVFVTRADPDPLMSYIDDVHMLIFEDTDNDGQVADTDPLAIRNFYEYGVMQNIYLKKGTVYHIYIVANLDDSNCPNGNVETFFDDVATYADLKGKYVQFLERTPRDLGKMIMSTQDIVTISLPNGSDVFAPVIPLQRLQSKFIVNIYNRVTSSTDRTVVSGVFPSTLSAVDLPRYSYVVSHNMAADGTQDYPFTLPDISGGYYESAPDFLPATEGPVEYPQGSGKWYTKQTVEFFSFENRRGSNTDINDYGQNNGDVPNVYGRKALAPDYSTYLQLTSLTQGNALLTYIHAGKGRDTEETTQPDDITNFDVDRSCIYHFNIVINSVKDVEVDTRRDFLDQLVIFTLPDVRRIDAHYMDIPSFIIGTTRGYAKMQSGTCDVDANGDIIYENLEPRNWRPMQDTDEDAVRWLRFSWGDPYQPTPARPINTSQYVGMTNVDGVTGATPVLHFNEYIDDVQKATVPAVNPSRRTAVVRIGFVSGATSAEEYEQGVEGNREAAFFVAVKQYGLKTIGQVGGYQNGVYTSLLGVESVEEYTLRYYSRDGFPQDVINNGPYWRYRDGFANHNQAYDGLSATKDHYNDYRGLFPGGVPPKRWDNVNIPSTGIYNPYSNTSAADYCMRKNRDEDGNGIIEGDEIKWYLPTPVQAMQMYTWRNAFKGGSYTLNLDYVPFGNGTGSASRYYWTTNEEVAVGYANAYVVDFVQQASLTTAMSKSARNPVRCVRDIPGTEQSMFYYSNGHLVADLTDNFPNLDTSKPGKGANDLREPSSNTLARTFLISRWYATGNSNHTGTPGLVSGNGSPNCDSYSESGYPAGRWFLPSQQELSLIYAYTGMIENILEQEFPGSPDTSTTYHTFRQNRHWAITNIGSNNTFWNVDFTTGYAQTLQKSGNTGYYRCVTYLTSPL